MIDANKLHFEMLRIRMIEEEIARKYKEQKMRCPVHLSIGQEAAAVGVASALNKNDKMVSTHRGHAHYLAKGGSLNGLIGELYGKVSGCSRGNGGSMHLIDTDVGFMGSTSIVGGTIPLGVGIAFAHHFKKEDHWSIVCIGDAAIEEGVFHEAANFAGLHQLKVIFVCENNLYSCFTRIQHRQPIRPMRYVALAHGLNYFLTQPNDVLDVNFKMKKAMSKVGPSFIEIPTYRFIEHCGPEVDDHLGYLSPDEIDFWKRHDPLKSLCFSSDEIDAIKEEINEAFDSAEVAPYPDGEAGKYVYAAP